MVIRNFPLVLFTLMVFSGARGQDQAFTPNYDESKVPAYTLPALMVSEEGKSIKDARSWRRERRPELIDLFEKEVYGKAPPRPDGLHFEIRDDEEGVLEGKADRKQVRIFFTESEELFMDLMQL